jgi:hypothetical protein
MYRTLVLFSFAAVAVMLGAGPAWMTRPMADWTQQDAKQVLANSPWVKFVTPAPMPAVNEGQHRDGGTMGGNSKGVGLRALLPTNLLGVGTGAKTEAPQRPVAIRWESALPIRSAETKTGEKLPEFPGEYYVISVYGIPAKLNRKSIESELRKTAFLQLDQKKPVKPARIEIMQLENGQAKLFYLFPRTLRIPTGQCQIEFMAQIESLYVGQFFSPQEMYFQGKLEL